MKPLIMNEHEHTFEDICNEEVCGICYENELMRGRVVFAPKHASVPVDTFVTIHMQNYRKQMKGKK